MPGLGLANPLAIALTTTGIALGWGNDADHHLFGGGSAVHRWRPSGDIDLSHLAQFMIAQTADHACVLLDDGTVRCWGGNAEGQLGLGASLASVGTPTVVPDLHDIAEIAGGDHTCARSCDGTIRCWGANLLGEVGDGTTERRATPVLVEFR